MTNSNTVVTNQPTLILNFKFFLRLILSPICFAVIFGAIGLGLGELALLMGVFVLLYKMVGGKTNDPIKEIFMVATFWFWYPFTATKEWIMTGGLKDF
jgi:hypothetical protein